MMQDVINLQNQSDTDVIRGVYIQRGANMSPLIWSAQDIQSKKRAFVSELKSAMLDRKPVWLESELQLSWVDEYGRTSSDFVTVRKRYAMLFINKEGRTSNHSPCDYDTMLQGNYIYHMNTL